MIIGIIGAGAAGMAAALAASENGRHQVILMERQARVGRKLQATGNGRCNLSNLHATQERYHGEDPAFVSCALAQYPPRRILEWFSDLGLYTVAEDSGRVYPYSDQANSVVDVLRFGLQKEHICLKTSFEVTKIKKNGPCFLVENGEETVRCDKLIIASGGLAGTKLGGSMAGYKLLRSLGHRCTKLRPTLVQIRSDWSGCPSLKGVRANCRATILRNGVPFAQSTGEIQFTEFGISGPVIFEISRDVCHEKGNWVCKLDFLPDFDLADALEKRRARALPVEELLTGILHNRLGRVLTQAAGVRGARTTDTLTDEELREIIRVVKGLEIPLTEPMGMDAAQVTAGGIVTSEFDPATMESRLVPGLFACGEILDIDGDCGGFNLQWAWSSGLSAGYSAGGAL